MSRSFEKFSGRLTYLAGLALFVAALLFLARAGFGVPSLAAESAHVIAPPAIDAQAASTTSEVAVLAGGCFWGVQGVFQHVEGVTNAVSGYAGGAKETAHYELVGSGRTGHAESVRITYDPRKISYGRLLQIYFSVAHNPTELNRQGPDTGTQYRSAIFYADNHQKAIAEAYIAELNRKKAFPDPIVTQVTPLKQFYPAEAYHQNYLALHPDNPYIVYNDQPKLDELQKRFPDLYKP